MSHNIEALIVDDNEINLIVAEELLSGFNMIIDSALSGQEAIAKAHEKTYNIIFMDYLMPGMDGIEAASQIRVINKTYETVPIIILTANEIENEGGLFLEKGLNGALSKPIDMDKLEKILEKWLPLVKNMSNTNSNNNISDEDNLSLIDRLGKECELDTHGAMRRLGGSSDVYLSILKLLKRNMVSKFQRFEHSLGTFTAGSDLEDFRIEVHGQKNALYNAGAMELSKTAGKLELAAAENDYEFLNLHAADFAAGLTRLSDLIGELLPKEEKTTNIAVETLELSELTADLDAAAQLLSDLEPDEALCLLEKYRGISFGDEEFINTIIDAIENFDYDSAEKVISQLKNVLGGG